MIFASVIMLALATEIPILTPVNYPGPIDTKIISILL